MRNANWTRDELIIAFNLYCKIPFGRIHIRNPQIIALAKALGRTPSAVSWKLANFASLDPSLKKRKISGASHGAKLDREVWDEFNENWDQLAFESERLLGGLSTASQISPETADLFPEGKTRMAMVRVRVNQAFFRSAVLAAYNSQCCITGLAVPDLLNASHIVPWKDDVKNRTNPRNGLCLSTVHHCAFDCGLITVTQDYRVKISTVIEHSQDRALKNFICRYGDARINLPKHFGPDPAFLEYHNTRVFRKN
jgi:putative restriction endonuclease